MFSIQSLKIGEEKDPKANNLTSDE